MKKEIIGVVAGVIIGGLLVFGVGSKMDLFGQKQETQVSETNVDTEESEAVETKKEGDTEESEAIETKKEGDTEESKSSKTKKDAKVNQGNSITNAYVMELGEDLSGTIDVDTSAWFAFKTEETEDINYHVVLVNETTEEYFWIVCAVLDEFGNELAYDKAEDDGTPITITTDELEPNTMYYIRLDAPVKGDVDYTLTVKTSDAE